MKKAGVAILGLGVVGGGTLEILLEKKKQIADEYGVDLTVVAVLDKFKEKVLKYGLDESIVADSIDDICDNPDVDIVVECMGGLEPAKTFLTKALLAARASSPPTRRCSPRAGSTSKRRRRRRARVSTMRRRRAAACRSYAL